MEKLRIGIATGREEGFEYDEMLRIVEDPSIIELCTPIIYGNLEKAISRSKELGYTPQFYSISQAEEIMDGKSCFMNLEAEEGQSMAAKCLDTVFSQWESSDTDVIVAMPEDEHLRLNPADINGMDMMLGRDIRIAMRRQDTSTDEDMQMLQEILKRDFRTEKPRIFILKDGDTDTLSLDTRKYMHYDAILADNTQQLLTQFMRINFNEGVLYTAGKDLICTTPCHGNAVGESIYTAIDILRNREFYDKNHENPLPKLFVDRHEHN